ncbi:NADH kinase Pos5p, mitochondrial [Monosporozyma unispora]|nr:NADH kinase pos5 [Kazachstania unispora]
MIRVSCRILPQWRFITTRRWYSVSKNVQIKPVTQLRTCTKADFVSAPNSKLQSMIWHNPLQNVLITKKPFTVGTRKAMVDFISHLHDSYPEINIIIHPEVADEISEDFSQAVNNDPNRPHVLYTGTQQEIVQKTDLLVTLGGDGTILHGVSNFGNHQVPPVLAFSLGTLGFLLPFDFEEYKDIFKRVISSRAKCLHRTRLECHVVKKGTNSKEPKNKHVIRRAMNDIFIHRGSAPHLANLDIYIDGAFLTRTIADGVVLSSPTGSTAYSLSAGGSIVSPLVPGILLTPICPRSLSFRPLLLPHSSHIKIKVGSKMNQINANTVINLSVDGFPQDDLHLGDEIHIINEIGTIYVEGTQIPPYYRDKQNGPDKNTDSLPEPHQKQVLNSGIYCVAKSENDWTNGINELLGFNSSFKFTRRLQDN